MHRSPRLLTCFALATCAPSLCAQEEASTSTDFGGPEEPRRQVSDEQERRSDYYVTGFYDAARPYFDWKERLEEEHGFTLGATAYWLFQNASETNSGDDEAFGAIYRIQGGWEAYGRGTKSPGKLSYRFEYRSDHFGLSAPQTLGADAGTASLNSGFAYSDGFDFDLAVLSWTQVFQDTVGIAVGRLSFDVYQDAFLFQTFSRGFLNRSFLVNPTIGTTGIGSLGGVAKGFISPNVWVGGQLYDANAKSGDFDFDTIQEGEFLTNMEIGWTPSRDRVKTDRIQLTWWHRDSLEKAGVSSGQGWAVSTSWRANEQWIPFARFGHSNGGAGVGAESAFSIGAEYQSEPRGFWSFGAGWADPSSATHGSGVDDEYVLETSYRIQLSPNFNVMPDIQVLIDPAKATDEDVVYVIGLRGIFSI